MEQPRRINFYAPVPSVLSMILIAWVGSWLGLDEVFRTGMHELFQLEVTNSSYYFVFLVVGLLQSFFNWRT